MPSTQIPTTGGRPAGLDWRPGRARACSDVFLTIPRSGWWDAWHRRISAQLSPPNKWRFRGLGQAEFPLLIRRVSNKIITTLLQMLTSICSVSLSFDFTILHLILTRYFNSNAVCLWSCLGFRGEIGGAAKSAVRSIPFPSRTRSTRASVHALLISLKREKLNSIIMIDATSCFCLIYRVWRSNKLSSADKFNLFLEAYLLSFGRRPQTCGMSRRCPFLIQLITVTVAANYSRVRIAQENGMFVASNLAIIFFEQKLQFCGKRDLRLWSHLDLIRWGKAGDSKFTNIMPPSKFANLTSLPFKIRILSQKFRRVSDHWSPITFKKMWWTVPLRMRTPDRAEIRIQVFQFEKQVLQFRYMFRAAGFSHAIAQLIPFVDWVQQLVHHY